MKKILNSILLLFLASSSALFVSCKEDEETAAPGIRRQKFWYCKCGLRNTGRVCVDCGAKK